ncbi:FAD:protein FMN transferase [Gordonia sp. VNQ95]|uniref:FAD:protein FMN transferase n=1 Tax=Gordonia TaxID=2053 RepID=UPI0032B47B24
MPSPRSRPKPPAECEWAFEALGTRWEITTDVPLDAHRRDLVVAELDRIDRYWSRFRADSTVAEMARTSGRYTVAAEDRALLDFYRELYTVTEGSVTPLVRQILDDAGYDAQYSLTPAAAMAAAPDWDDVIGWDGTYLDVRTPAVVDVGAAGKGFAVDRVAAIIADGLDRYIVDAGGDMVISPRDEPVRIALEHPLDPTKAIGVVALAGGALCGSASNRRTWADWHHIVDPRTARPTDDVLATWVYAPDAMTADGLATALFFTAARRLAGCGEPAIPGPAAATLSVGSDIAGFRLERNDIPTRIPKHVTIRSNGTVDHTRIPGLELYL